jgi:heterodisulfide reductase subunit A
VSLTREPARIMVAVCRCGRTTTSAPDLEFMAHALWADPAVSAVVVVENLCTAGGREQMTARVRKAIPNRLLIGACLPHAHQRALTDLIRECGQDPSLIEVIDIAPWAMASAERGPSSISDISPKYWPFSRIASASSPMPDAQVTPPSNCRTR